LRKLALARAPQVGMLRVAAQSGIDKL
jgi:hypothetical protein